MPSYQVSWEDVKKAANAAFDLWHDSGELAWAETAWAHLTAAGLTTFSSDAERHRVLVRFLALPSFYRDWSALVDDERRTDCYDYWAESLDIRAFPLAQLLGPDVEISEDTEARQISAALNFLVPALHDEVAQALVEGFGGDNDLFLSLWRILHRAPDPADPEEAFHYEDDWEALNCPTVSKMCGYEWIVSGCPSNRWSREHSDE